MSYIKQKSDNFLLYDTAVENIFISEYAKNAPGDYVKVYLLALMYAEYEKDVDNAKLAAELSLNKQQVEDAWDYWRECGLVEVRERGDGSGKTEIEFISIKEKFFGAAPKKEKNSSFEKLRDKDISNLFKDIEKETGRLLEAKEPEAVAVWVKDFGIRPEIVLLGYRYCVKNGRSTRYRYVDKILMAWNERGLDTEEKVREYLSETDRKYDFYKKVFKALGFRRNPTQAEADIMDSWVDKLGCSLDDVLSACKKTSGISNPSINYINSILVSEKSKSSAEDAEENARILKAVEERYERIREANARKGAALREKIYTDIPRLREVQDESMSLGIFISRCILKGPAGKAELEDAREKQQKLSEEKKALLLAGGYREDALNPIYTCSKCNDTGTLEDGRRCSCYLDRLKEVRNEQ